VEYSGSSERSVRGLFLGLGGVERVRGDLEMRRWMKYD